MKVFKTTAVFKTCIQTTNRNTMQTSTRTVLKTMICTQQLVRTNIHVHTIKLLQLVVLPTNINVT
jgi:hypothetical protein